MGLKELNRLIAFYFHGLYALGKTICQKSREKTPLTKSQGRKASLLHVLSHNNKPVLGRRYKPILHHIIM